MNGVVVWACLCVIDGNFLTPWWSKERWGGVWAGLVAERSLSRYGEGQRCCLAGERLGMRTVCGQAERTRIKTS